MGDRSDHFSDSEFDCSCGCGKGRVTDELIETLELGRVHFGKRMHVNSGFRCLVWNRVPVKEGGPGSNDRSQHPKGTAGDVVVDDTPADEVYDFFESLGVGGLGRYDEFTHVDVRPNGPARW